MRGVLICFAVALALAWSALILVLRRMKREEEKNHCWRPALTSHGPARTCICGATEQLTDAEFYAQFGTMPNVGIIAK